MTASLRAELRKLTRTRSLVALPVAGLVIAAIGTVVFMAAGKATEIPARLSEYGPLRFGPSNFGLLLAVFGVRLFADESQHRTLAATLIRTPNRLRVLAAKVLVAAGVAAAFCAAVYLIVIPVTLVGLSMRGLTMAVDAGATAALFGRVVVATVLLTALGVAVGTAVRNRTVALVAVIVWFALAEDLIGGLLHIKRFLPSAAMQSLVSASASAGTTAPVGALLLLAVVATALVAAVVALRTDVA
jgi:ABC-type transport system involved in multi-copper enzyme maturation permease subunit